MLDIFIAGQNSVKVLTGCGFVYVLSANSEKISFLFTLGAAYLYQPVVSFHFVIRSSSA